MNVLVFLNLLTWFNFSFNLNLIHINLRIHSTQLKNQFSTQYRIPPKRPMLVTLIGSWLKPQKKPTDRPKLSISSLWHLENSYFQIFWFDWPSIHNSPSSIWFDFQFQFLFINFWFFFDLLNVFGVRKAWLRHYLDTRISIETPSPKTHWVTLMSWIFDRNQLNSYCEVVPSYTIKRQLALSTLTFDSRCTIKLAYFKMTRPADYLEISKLSTHIRLNLNQLKVMVHLFLGSALWTQLL